MSLRAARDRKGWSQQQLATAAGVTRQLVGAVEVGRHSPNVTAALALAKALDTTVETLFAADDANSDVVVLPSEQPSGVAAVQTVRVGNVMVGVPLVNSGDPFEGWAIADAMVHAGSPSAAPTVFEQARVDGLALAGCDPLLPLLGALANRASGHRIITTHASTGRALTTLAAGHVHGVVVHSKRGSLPTPSLPVRRWHLAAWQVGLAFASQRGQRALAIEQLAEGRTPVVQRETAASSQQAFVRALTKAGARTIKGPIGSGHIDVARRVAQGGGKAGVTMEAAAHAFGLPFLPLEAHDVELWIAERFVDHPAVQSLLDQLDTQALTARASALGGYDLARHGAIR
jgi:DNA-binding XRE family transcriptional regulator